MRNLTEKKKITLFSKLTFFMYKKRDKLTYQKREKKVMNICKTEKTHTSAPRSKWYTLKLVKAALRLNVALLRSTTRHFKRLLWLFYIQNMCLFLS